MENPHVHDNLQHIQAVLSNYDTSFLSDDEEDYCPLCMEPLDITDKNFKPCPCGYQICQFCYNNIRQNPELNGRCPACRRKYDDESVEYIVLSPEELKLERAKQARKERERKQREKERKENEYANRKHLAGMRVIQKNLVYVIGLNPPVPYEEVGALLRSDKYFGQYGKINKIVVNRKTGHNDHQTGYGIYVTFSRKEDAARCIQAVDGTFMDGRQVKAAYGTTKYCSSYLRGQSCPNPNCMFLHEPGEEADSFNKRELSSKQQPHQQPHSHASQHLPSQLQTSVHQPAQVHMHQLNAQSHIHHPSPFKGPHNSGAVVSNTSNGASAAPSPAQVKAQLHMDDSSSSSTPAAHTPILTPAPLPTGANPWGITQSSTPVSAISKVSSSTAFPTLGEAINTPAPAFNGVQATASTCNQNGSSKNKKNNDTKTYEDPYDPLCSAVKFIDDTINFLSDYKCVSYRLRSGLIDDATYASYPSLFSFSNIDISDESEGILGRKLIDMLAVKPWDQISATFPAVNDMSPQLQRQVLRQQQMTTTPKQQQSAQMQRNIPDPNAQVSPASQLQQQQRSHSQSQQDLPQEPPFSQQQQHRAVVNTPPPGMFVQNGQISQAQSVPHMVAQTRSNNSTDLLNQLINGKKVTAGT
ncbi:AaceriADL064Wp [[Ashbya] aceris (nom. inval.)]|nr:AaceriADL064Wp [[Ashbya] aceris (nom. inval.)]